MKKNYSERLIQVSEILLDQDNPRFPPVNNQREAIQAMVKDQGNKIFNLAFDIYQNGLNPSSKLILFKEGGKYIDGDGNRRLTALKLLDTPSLADSEPRIKKKFDTLLKKSGVVPSAVDCVIFETRDDAKHWISINHSGPQDGKGQIPWDAEQKERFSGGFSIGLQALDILHHKGLINDDDKSRIKKTTLDRVLEYKKVKEKLTIGKRGDHFTFGKVNDLKKIALALRDVSVDKVYTAEKGIEFVEDVLNAEVENRNPQHTKEHCPTPEDFKPSTSSEPARELNEESGNANSVAANNSSAMPRSRRTVGRGLTTFGGALSLKEGHINNLYRDIEEIYRSYKSGRIALSEDFIVIFRMSLRMLAETACKDIDKNKNLDSFLKENFDNAKSSLSQDEKTSLSNQSVDKNKIVQLFQTGAHEYSNSRNEEQAVALSIILGAILKITHGKHS